MHIDRVRKRQIACRAGVMKREIKGGWLSATRGGDTGVFPAESMDRAYWLTLDSPLTREHVASALEAAKELSCRRLFMWIAPWAHTADVAAMLAAGGAREWPGVSYIALTRESGELIPERLSLLRARRIEPDEAPALLDTTSPWFGMLGAETAKELVARGISELFAAFDGGTPVSVAFLTLDGDWAYLGAAGTAPGHRSRGGQTELIRARLKFAAERGAARCSCETHTALPVSLGNLRRCGFIEEIAWRVYVMG